MYTIIVFLPFLAAIVSGLFGRTLGAKGVHIFNIICLLITTILSFIAFYEVVICNSPVSVELFSWVNLEYLKISWSFYYDELTVSMLIPVIIVSLLVHLYSVGYMGEDPHQQRFFSYISLFTGLMLVLVTGSNLLVMFVGWEGVGVCSYLLVHFWYTRVAAVKSSMNAMFTNRVGDYFLTIGFFAVFFTFGTLDYATVFSLAPYVNENIITFISLLLLLGAAAKSAQLGLHIWLPQAMEGPTPVSALIHAATMVNSISCLRILKKYKNVFYLYFDICWNMFFAFKLKETNIKYILNNLIENQQELLSNNSSEIVNEINFMFEKYFSFNKNNLRYRNDVFFRMIYRIYWRWRIICHF